MIQFYPVFQEAACGFWLKENLTQPKKNEKNDLNQCLLWMKMENRVQSSSRSFVIRPAASILVPFDTLTRFKIFFGSATEVNFRFDLYPRVKTSQR